MYREHFGLLDKPFNLRPDPGYLYLSDRHTIALRMLEYGLFEQDGYTVITGEVGSGKTTLVRYLLETLEHDFQIGLISNTHKAFGDLLHWVVSAFGIRREGRTDAELHDAFVDFLVSGYRYGKRTLLIIDEAQNLGSESLEEVRVLSNINADGAHVMQLLLVGQPELRDLLRRRELTQVAQRVSTHYHLETLDRESVAPYIRHRLRIAGAQGPIFTESAVELIGRGSGGIPRLINQICETALVYAFSQGEPLVHAETVRNVLDDRHASRVLPTAGEASLGGVHRDATGGRLS